MIRTPFEWQALLKVTDFVHAGAVVVGKFKPNSKVTKEAYLAAVASFKNISLGK